MYLLQDRHTFAFSAENPTGTRNGGTWRKDCDKLSAYWYLDHSSPVPFVLPEDKELIMK